MSFKVEHDGLCISVKGENNTWNNMKCSRKEPQTHITAPEPRLTTLFLRNESSDGAEPAARLHESTAALF